MAAAGRLAGFGAAKIPTELGSPAALVAEAIPLAQQRSTDEGLIRFLEVATGLTGFGA
ncbi:MAG: hypothetical protein IPK53_03265 [bacterium]|nr:hypothetical protein [bacterium]